MKLLKLTIDMISSLPQIIVDHELHEFTRIYVLSYNGDLFGRTNFHECKRERSKISTIIEFV